MLRPRCLQLSEAYLTGLRSMLSREKEGQAGKGCLASKMVAKRTGGAGGDESDTATLLQSQQAMVRRLRPATAHTTWRCASAAPTATGRRLAGAL